MKLGLCARGRVRFEADTLLVWMTREGAARR